MTALPPLVLVHGLWDTPRLLERLTRQLAGARDPLLIPHLPHRLGATRMRPLAERLGAAIEAAFGPDQPIDLLGRQHPQRTRDVDIDLVANGFDTGGHLGQQSLVGTAHRGDDAELGGTGLGGLLGRLHQAGHIEPGAAHRRGEEPRLRTEVTVLRASPGLEADDAFDFDFGPAPAHPHLVGERQQFLKPVVGKPQNLEHLVTEQSVTPLKNLFTGLSQDVKSCLGHAP